MIAPYRHRCPQDVAAPQKHRPEAPDHSIGALRCLGCLDCEALHHSPHSAQTITINLTNPSVHHIIHNKATEAPESRCVFLRVAAASLTRIKQTPNLSCIPKRVILGVLERCAWGAAKTALEMQQHRILLSSAQ